MGKLLAADGVDRTVELPLVDEVVELDRKQTVAWQRWNNICVMRNNNTREISYLEYFNRRIRRG